MAVAFQVDERIARSPESVWRRLTDWEGAAEWMPGIEAIRALGPTAVGTRLEFRARGKSRPSEITHLEQGRALTLTSHQGPVSAAYTYRCRPEGDGTHLELVADCEVRGPLRVLAPLLRRVLRSSDAGQLAALKACLERDAESCHPSGGTGREA